MTERPDSQLRLGVIADIHLAPAGTPATSWHGPIHGAQMRSRLREALACLSSEEVGAIVLLGDLTEGADRESMDAVLLDCGGLSRPTFVVPGNCESDRMNLRSHWPVRPPAVRLSSSVRRARCSQEASASPGSHSHTLEARLGRRLCLIQRGGMGTRPFGSATTRLSPDDSRRPMQESSTQAI